MHRWRKKEVKVLVKKCEAGKYELYQNIADIFVYTVYVYTVIRNSTV